MYYFSLIKNVNTNDNIQEFTRLYFSSNRKIWKNLMKQDKMAKQKALTRKNK